VSAGSAGTPQDAGDEATVERPRLGLALPDKPSLAILVFANLSGDPDEYLADAIVADIITELSRCGEPFVIARNSSFQYKGKAVNVRQVGRDLGCAMCWKGAYGGPEIAFALPHRLSMPPREPTAGPST
jgi:TolB-like protein